MAPKFTSITHHLINAYLAWFKENNLTKVTIWVDAGCTIHPLALAEARNGAVPVQLGKNMCSGLEVAMDGLKVVNYYQGQAVFFNIKAHDILGIEIPINGRVMGMRDITDHEHMWQNYEDLRPVGYVPPKVKERPQLRLVQ